MVMMMTRTTSAFVFSVFAALSAVACGQLTLEINRTTYTGTSETIALDNFPVVWWAPSNTTPATELLMAGWVFSPLPPSQGHRYTRMRVNFTDCNLGPSNKLLVFPSEYPTIAINLTSQTQAIPDGVFQVNFEALGTDNATGTVLSATDLFICFKCCIAAYSTGGGYLIQQDNSTCTITLSVDPDSVAMVNSLKLFYGLIVVIAVPALGVLAGTCCVRPRAPRETKTDSEFLRRRTKCTSIAFLITFLAAFVVFVAAFLARM